MREVNPTSRPNQTIKEVQMSGSGFTTTKREPSVSTGTPTPITFSERIKRASFRVDGAGSIKLRINPTGADAKNFITLRKDESWTPFMSVNNADISAVGSVEGLALEYILEG